MMRILMKFQVPMTIVFLVIIMSGCCGSAENEADENQSTTFYEPVKDYDLGSSFNNEYTVIVGNPKVICHGETSIQDWGPYQFPTMGRTINNEIYITCSSPEHQDTIEGYETEPLCYIIDEQGEMLREIQYSSLVKADIKMPNGCYLQESVSKNAESVDWLDKYSPDYESEKIRYYRADKIPEYNNEIIYTEYDPKTATVNEFTSVINWPNMPVVCVDGLLMSMNSLVGPATYYVKNDELYMYLYSYGFDSITGYVTNGQYNIYVFSSKDSARTWNFVGQLLSIENQQISSSQGFCEPGIGYDGEWFYMLMRTGNGLPCFFSQSRDNKSWSKPTVFSEVGVKPQLCLLNNGFLVASYGRPGIYLRVSKDKKTWSMPLSILDQTYGTDQMWNYSCCYTSLLPITDDTFLVAYSDFKYKNQDGGSAKTIIVRQISIKASN